MDCFPNCLRACASLGYDVDDEMLWLYYDIFCAFRGSCVINECEFKKNV